MFKKQIPVFSITQIAIWSKFRSNLILISFFFFVLFCSVWIVLFFHFQHAFFFYLLLLFFCAPTIQEGYVPPQFLFSSHLYPVLLFSNYQLPSFLSACIKPVFHHIDAHYTVMSVSFIKWWRHYVCIADHELQQFFAQLRLWEAASWQICTLCTLNV